MKSLFAGVYNFMANDKSGINGETCCMPNVVVVVYAVMIHLICMRRVSYDDACAKRACNIDTLQCINRDLVHMRSILRFVFLTCEGTLYRVGRSELLSNCFLALRYRCIIQELCRDEEVRLIIWLYFRL